MASMQDEKALEEAGQALVNGRKGRVWLLLILVGLIILGMGGLTWAVSVHRHKASTYGISDPMGSVLKIENRASDFAITRVSIAGAEERVVLRELGIEIGSGESTILELSPGTFLVTVDYAEAGVVVPFRPQGSLSRTIVVSPGKAVLLSFEGGRSSPEASIFIPPVLILK